MGNKQDFEEVRDKVKCEVEKAMNNIVEDELKLNDVDLLGKLVDIHTDLANEDYWKEKKEVMSMRYREEGNYGRRGRYSEGSYGRRGVKGTGRGRYRGDEMMEEMQESYQEYNEGREQYGRGNYRAKEDSMKSLEYMLQSVVEFMEMLEEDAGSQEEVELIKKYTRKISEM